MLDLPFKLAFPDWRRDHALQDYAVAPCGAAGAWREFEWSSAGENSPGYYRLKYVIVNDLYESPRT
jgi:hypothetical protein